MAAGFLMFVVMQACVPVNAWVSSNESAQRRTKSMGQVADGQILTFKKSAKLLPTHRAGHEDGTNNMESLCNAPYGALTKLKELSEGKLGHLQPTTTGNIMLKIDQLASGTHSEDAGRQSVLESFSPLSSRSGRLLGFQ